MSRMQLDTAAAHECYTELLRREMSTAVGWDALYAPSALMRAPRVEELISHKKYENRLSAYLKAVPLTDTLTDLRMQRSRTSAALLDLEKTHERMWDKDSHNARPALLKLQPPGSRQQRGRRTPDEIRGTRRTWDYNHTGFHHEDLGPATRSVRAARKANELHAFDKNGFDNRFADAFALPTASRAEAATDTAPRPTAHIPTRPRRLGMHGAQASSY